MSTSPAAPAENMSPREKLKLWNTRLEAGTCMFCGSAEIYLLDEGVTDWEANVAVGRVKKSLKIPIPPKKLLMCESHFLHFMAIRTAQEADDVRQWLALQHDYTGTYEVAQCERCGNSCQPRQWLNVMFGGESVSVNFRGQSGQRLCKNCYRSKLRFLLIEKAANLPEAADAHERAKLMAGTLQQAETMADELFAKVWG